MSGLPESGHGWAIYEPLLVVVILTDKLRMHRPLRRRGAGLDSIVLPVRIFPVGSRDPIRGERPSSADATTTPSSCQDRGNRLGAEGARRRSAGRCG